MFGSVVAMMMVAGGLASPGSAWIGARAGPVLEAEPVHGLESLGAGGAALSSDTLVQVDRGTRVVIQLHEGSVVVRGWDRDAVEVITEDADDESRVRIGRSAGSLTVHTGGRWGEPVEADLTLNVPASSPLKVHGPFADVQIEGVERDVIVETVDGDIRLRGGTEVVTLHTVEGDIEVRDVSGRVELHSMDGDVAVAGVDGDVSVNTVDGDVRLRGVASSNVKAQTVDGDILFTGELRPSGIYRLSTHDGDVYVTVPENSGAVVSVATWGGEFSASFPIAWQGRRDGKRMEFTIGNGGARLELQSFDGEIRLIRPGEPLPGNR